MKFWPVLLVLLCACTVPEESGSIQVCFTSQHNCTAVFQEYLVREEVRGCVFYDLDHQGIRQLAEKTPLLMHHEYATETAIPIYGKGLMHHKFCFSDRTVLTGSTNPTKNGLEKNANNLVIVESAALSKNYREEFGNVQAYAHKRTPAKNLVLNGHPVENYFCPRDDCTERVQEKLRDAEDSIRFLLFTITDKDIATTLLQKARTVQVEGIAEPSQVHGYSLVSLLRGKGIPVRAYDAVGKLHHKVFIIDNATVITGSYNPTAAGTEINRENILIFHDPEIASLYLQEYVFLQSLSKSINMSFAT